MQPSRCRCACVHHQKSVRSKANPSPKLTLPKIEKVDPEVDLQVAVRLFNVASTQIGSDVLH